ARRRRLQLWPPPALARRAFARPVAGALHSALGSTTGLKPAAPSYFTSDSLTSSQIDPVRLALACNISQAAKRSASHSRTTRKAHTMATPADDMLASTNSRTMTKISAFMAAEYPTPSYRRAGRGWPSGSSDARECLG